MSPERLKRFEGLYRLSRYMGAADILRKFLGLSDDAPVPLSLSHGVDFGHYHHPCDIDVVEPLHWSYNREIHDAASAIKPSIFAPHPWAITTHTRTVPRSRGVLVVGPPPSPENDQRLYELIKTDANADWTVLVKARGEYQGSIAFWTEQGLNAITARGPDGSFYERLFGIIAGFDTIVGCTFSSALVFAASLGKNVALLKTYSWEVYEPANYENEVWLHSPRARQIVRRFADGNSGAKHDLARELLGFDALADVERIREDLRLAIEALKRPYNANRRHPVPYKVRELMAVTLKKPGLLQYSVRDILTTLRRRHVCVLRMNDVDVWLNGKNESNFCLTPVTFQKGITEPGLAPRGYGAGMRTE